VLMSSIQLLFSYCLEGSALPVDGRIVIVVSTPQKGGQALERSHNSSLALQYKS
jgi:hypothetical protein